MQFNRMWGRNVKKQTTMNAWENGEPVLTEEAPTDHEPAPGDYAKAGEALSRICFWVFTTPDGKVRTAKDSKCRMLAAATVANPTGFQPESYTKAAKENGFTMALLALRIREFCKAFNMPIPQVHGMDTEQHKAQRNKSYGV